jgi:hypothetical protein
MSTTSSFVPRPLSAGIVVLAAALALVPAIARARQQVDRKDATRLSIKHSWLGVAPPTKASAAPTQVAVLPAPVVAIDRGRPAARVDQAHNAAPRLVDRKRFDPPRGPPSRHA